MLFRESLVEEKLSEYRGKNIFLYGAKNMGTIAAKLLRYFDLNVVGYIVTKGAIGTLNGLPIRNLEDISLKETKNAEVILTLNDFYHNEIIGLLNEKGFTDIDATFTVTQIAFLKRILNQVFENHGVDMSKRVFEYESFKMLNPFEDSLVSAFYLECGDIILPTVFNHYDWLTEGAYEQGQVKLCPGDTVIDCGANIGMFSCVAASKGCFVLAFEPSAGQIGEILKEHSDMYEGRIRHIELALSDSIGEVEFNVSDLSQGSSFLSDISHNKGKVINKVINVKTTTIDHWVNENKINKVDFIKADIEGAERLMLAGAKETLKHFAPKLAICTYHYPDDPKVLEDLILQANPNYTVIHGDKKLYAWCDNCIR